MECGPIESGQRRTDISIIIPMYNAEDYLERCLDSILAQDFPHFEAIMVDDGSTDGTQAIARRYADKDPRFRLIAKRNGGVSSARNAGLSVAEGDYLAFIDSDDFVHPSFLKRLFTAAVGQEADVVCCNFNRYFPKSGVRLPHLMTKAPGGYGSAPILKSLLHDVSFQSYLWNKLWRRSLFVEHQITFPNMLFEDTHAAFQLFFYAGKIVILPETLYNYTQRGDSIVHTLGAKSGNDFLRAFVATRTFLEQSGVYSAYRPHFRYFAVKSLLFLWGVAFLTHFRRRNFSGFGGNLRRVTEYMTYYGGAGFLSDGTGPDCAGMLREPPSLRKGGKARKRAKALRSRDAA